MINGCALISAEEYFTSRSMIDVKELKENYPDFALVLDINDEELPNTSNLAYKQVPVHDLQVGSFILVGAGEVWEQIYHVFLFFSIWLVVYSQAMTLNACL